MFRLNFWAQSVLSPSGVGGSLPFSGPVQIDPRYLSGVTPILPPPPPPPPMSMLYNSPPPLMPPEPFYRRPTLIGGFSDDSDKSSPELTDVDSGGVGTTETGGRTSPTGRVLSGGHHGHRGLDCSGIETSHGRSAASRLSGYPSLQLLHSQLEALRHYQQQQQQRREMTQQDAAGELFTIIYVFIYKTPAFTNYCSIIVIVVLK